MRENSSDERIRLRLLLRGMVQGIGFRPYVWRLAREHRLGGFVGNESRGAFVEVEGDAAEVASFRERLLGQPPPLARIDGVEAMVLRPLEEDTFRIVPSQLRPDDSTAVSPDLGICADCLRELRDPANRRFGYPFVNCTHCGPRFTIVERLPYDRPHTTMRRFVMCEACAAEYSDPADRRFHAQPNACWECGPSVWLALPGVDDGEASQGREALAAARRLLDEGAILAVKGIGGFHLACDATNPEAVQRLRERKGRAEKPFAVMVEDTAEARLFAAIDAGEQALLESRERPIVLLEKRADAELRLAAEVAPESPHWGVMLAYTPLHHLLLRGEGELREALPGASRVLVMTSGNWSEEPIARENSEALERLAPLANAYLLHDRDIRVVADDSVVRIVGGSELPLRRSRGYAPLPVKLPRALPSLLAVGGELKATFCLTKGDYAYLSQHIGDVGNLETQRAFERALDHFLALFRVSPEAVVCDRHPGYLSTAWAKRYAAVRGLPLFEVQHHHAHGAALLAEHGLTDEQPFLAAAFDGTGYGEDGAIWGGEFLRFHGGTIRRVAHLRYMPLPGGDAAIRHPWRCAAAHLREAGFSLEEIGELLPGHATELPLLWRQLERNLHCVPTSSMGRLFDAVAAVVGLHHSVSFEAQAAMQLEALSVAEVRGEPYLFKVRRGAAESGDTAEGPQVVDVRPLWRGIVEDVRAELPAARVAARFHATVAAMVVAVARQECGADAGIRVGLTGGVFQNVRLLGETRALLEAAGMDVYSHRVVPANDGGLSLGQAYLAGRNLVI